MDTAEPADALPTNESSRPEAPRAPYRHDAAHIPALARLADAACEDVDDPPEAGVRVEQLAEQMAPAAERPDARAVALAFSYNLRRREIPRGGGAGPAGWPVDISDGDARKSQNRRSTATRTLMWSLGDFTRT
ncbi:hypothetical protein SAMN05216266_11454 [Amycolatopsis marina]|uniref:Uncharacterized protein n=1 Tax=Amycolatopsis marina TaxID=490629 RepID=A0A1I1BGY1_9PSEU|nr:hypothetical protein SAMN05216266_11454 [Amycolatopsis marina]